MTNEAKTKWFHQTLADQQLKLISYTHKILRNKEQSKEVVQESYCKLWLQEYPAITLLIPPWLYRVCRNHSIDILRKENRLTPIDLEDGSIFMIGVDFDNVADSAIALKEINKLNPKHKEALILKFSHDLSYKEIAKIMNITTSHVGVLIHEGILEVRKSLGLTKQGGQS